MASFSVTNPQHVLSQTFPVLTLLEALPFLFLLLRDIYIDTFRIFTSSLKVCQETYTGWPQEFDHINTVLTYVKFGAVSDAGKQTLLPTSVAADRA